MEHRETIRIVSGASNAVLFIHGIAGTPEHFRNLIPLESLVPEEWSVYNLLLDGHGRKVSDFARSSMKKWLEQVGRIFDMLCHDHERVIVVGHSMGTLFAIDLAAAHPDRVESLFLLAVPMRPGLRLSGILNMLRLVFGKIREDRPVEAALKTACGVEPTKKVWKYLGWIPRFLELFVQIIKTERRLADLKVPCIAFQSGKDELVMNLSSRILKGCKAMNVRDLPESGHFYYAPEDRKNIIEEFRKIIKNTPD